MLLNGVEVALEKVLKTTRCGCSSSQCRTKRCACVKADADCTEICTRNDCENHKDLSLNDEGTESDENSDCEDEEDDE